MACRYLSAVSWPDGGHYQHRGPRRGPQGPHQWCDRQERSGQTCTVSARSCLLSSLAGCLCFSLISPSFFPVVMFIYFLIFSFFSGHDLSQCTSCHVCQQRMPSSFAPGPCRLTTGAIAGEESPFSRSVSVSFCSRRLINPQEKTHLKVWHS